MFLVGSAVVVAALVGSFTFSRRINPQSRSFQESSSFAHRVCQKDMPSSAISMEEIVQC